MALMLAAMLTMENAASQFAATNPNSRSAVASNRAPGLRGVRRSRHGVDIQAVQREVDRDHGPCRSRAPAARCARGPDLLGDVRGGIPSGVGEHHRNQRHQHAGHGALRRRLLNAASDPVPIANPTARNDERGDLQHRETVLHELAGPAARRHVRREQSDDRGRPRSGRHVEGEQSGAARDPSAWCHPPRHETAEQAREADGFAAIAPENPATNDVHPVRNAASGPNASRRYTYSPPALGRSAASSA